MSFDRRRADVIGFVPRASIQVDTREAGPYIVLDFVGMAVDGGRLGETYQVRFDTRTARAWAASVLRACDDAEGSRGGE